MDFTRQSGIVDSKAIASKRVTLIGAGSVGSFAALALSKLGVEKLTVYDRDEIEDHNLPNQFYPLGSVGELKVRCLGEMIRNMTGNKIIIKNEFYSNQLLPETVVVATDTMSSRATIFAQFSKQKKTRYLIEARMGGELGYVYCIDKQNKTQMKKYAATLYSDDKAVKIPCTERTIIYNVLMISSLICRAFKAVVTKETNYPYETIFDMRNMMFYKDGKNA
jgi:hypothetical protein